MADFVDPFSSLSQGIQQGTNLALTIGQVKSQNKAREQELALKAADAKLTLAKSFKDPKERMKLISSAAQDYGKAGVDIPQIDPNAFLGEGASKKMSEALNLWSKNVEGGTWTAEFGRNWLIKKGAEIGQEGEELNALQEHAYKEALKTEDKASKKIDPFVFDSMASQLGLSTQESQNIRQKYPQLLEMPLDQLKTAMESQLATKSKNESLERQVEKADIILRKVNEAIETAGPLTTGLGAASKVIYGSPARDYAGVIETIKSGLGLGELQAMKETSKTGASGFGALSERELSLLESSVASLDQGQRTPQIKKNLSEVYAHYANWKNAVKGTIPRFENEESALAAVKRREIRNGIKVFIGDKLMTWEN